MEASVANENIVKNLEEQIVANMKEVVVPQSELEGEVLPELTNEKVLPSLSEEIQPNFEGGGDFQPNLQKEVLPKLNENIMPELNEEIATDKTGEDDVMGGEPGKNGIVFASSSPLLGNVHVQHLPLKPVEMNFPHEAEVASGKEDDMEKITESLELEAEATQVRLEPTKSKSKNGDDNDSLNQNGNLKSKSSSSEIVVGEQQQKKSKESYCCPKQVLRLLADYEYYFREEEWKLKGNFQADNPERTHLVVIVAEKDEKKRLTGMGMAGNFKLAESSAALDLCEQLHTEHHLVLPKSQIYPDLRLSSNVLNALHTECNMRQLSAPWFKQTKGRSAYGSLRTCNVVVGEIKKQGKGLTDYIAKQDAAYKMYEAITGEAFPLVEIIKGQHCSAGDYENRYDQTSNRELPMLKLRIPKRGLIPSGFRESLEGAAPLMSDDDIYNSNDVEPHFEVPSKGLLLMELSNCFKNNESKATKLGVEQVALLSQAPASSTAADVDQNQKDGAESASVIASDIAAIREVVDDFHPKTNESASHNLIPRVMTSLAVLGVVFAVVAYAIKK